MKKKILMVVGSYFPEISGAGLQCYNIVNNLKDKFSFQIFTTVINYTKSNNEFNNEKNVYRIFLKPNSIFNKIFSFFKFLFFFISQISDFNIIHIHGISNKSILFIIFGKLFFKKIILKLTNFEEDDFITIKKRSIILFYIINLVDRVIVISPAFIDNAKIAGFNLSKIEFIPNFVDTNLYTPTNQIEKKIFKKNLKLYEDIPTIIFVGFYSNRKRPDVVYKMWKENFIQGVKSNLILIGSYKGKYFELNQSLFNKIQNDLKKNNFEKFVKLIDYTKNIHEYYKAADIFILPSLNEGLPNALLEAMSSGLVPLITNIHGVAGWIVEDKVNGFIIDIDDNNTLRKLIVNINETNLLGLKSRKSIIKKFDKKKLLTKMSNLYENL